MTRPSVAPLPRPPATRPSSARVLEHLRELLRLAGPAIVARAGLVVMVLVDTVMVGRYATAELAYLSIGNALVVVLMITGIGLLLGTIATVAQALGRGALAECGAAWQRSLPYAFLIGILAAGICAFGETLLTLTGQEPELAREGGRVMVITGLGLPFALLFITTVYFLEGIKRPIPGMIAMILANVLNALLNWGLIYGNAGMPELGAEGSAWTTTIVRACLALGLIVYALNMPGHQRFGVRRWQGWQWRAWAGQRRIGYGGGASLAVESSAFTALNLFAGWLGEVDLAAFSIGLNVIGVLFMIAVGFSSAAAVRVGFAYGRGDAADTALAGWTGLIVSTLALAIPSGLLIVMPEMTASIYTPDSVLLGTAVPLVVLAGLIVLPDGGQAVMANVLRARGDALAPFLLHVVSYLVFMIPLSWLLAFPLKRGVAGLFEGILIASIVSVILLSTRFYRLCRRDLPASPIARTVEEPVGRHS